MHSPASSPSRGGGYQGGSGPPTPEGLQYQHQQSAGSSQATTPAQNAGNSEWDMFFANRCAAASLHQASLTFGSPCGSAGVVCAVCSICLVSDNGAGSRDRVGLKLHSCEV